MCTECPLGHYDVPRELEAQCVCTDSSAEADIPSSRRSFAQFITNGQPDSIVKANGDSPQLS